MLRSFADRVENQRGITYLMLMFAIVLIGIATTAAAKQWKAMVQRELEADLLAKGMEIQNALALYSATMKAGRVMPGEVYPQTLAELARLPKPFLRKAYLDPLTHGEWDYLRAPNGGIMGVRSKSVAEPFRKHDFPAAVRHFDGRKSHREWVFQYPNPSTSVSLPPASEPPQQGAGANPIEAAPSPGQSMPGNGGMKPGAGEPVPP